MSQNSLLTKYSKHLLKQKFLLTMGVIAMVVVAISEGIIPKLVKDLLDSGFKAPEAPTLGLLADKQRAWYALPEFYMPTLIFLVACVRSVGQFLSQFALNKAKSFVVCNLQQHLFKHIVGAHMPALKHTQSSSLIHTLMFELQQAYDYLLDAMIISIRDSITLIVLLGYLCYLNWQLTGITLIILPILAILIKRLKQRLKQLNQQHHHYLQQSAYQIQQIFSSLDVVKAYSAQTYEQNLFKQLSQNLKQFTIKISTTTALNQPITQIIASMALCIVIGIAIQQAGSGAQSVGSFTSFIMAMLLLISPLKRLSDLNQPLTRAKLAFEHVENLLNLPQEQTKQTAKASFKQLSVDNLSICYHKQDNSQSNIAVQNISFKMQYGQKIAFIGLSGSGKSSLMKALLGLVDYDGKFMLDDKQVAHVRSIASYVGQDTHLFARTLLENIAYGIDLSQLKAHLTQNEQALKSIEQRALHCLDKVNLQEWALEHGLHNPIGNNGDTLSGGQRQRLAIARSLYTDSKLLLLDEATSGLDANNQEIISNCVQNLNCSVIAIAHRLQTVMHFDCIYLMQQGNIIAKGSHQHLLHTSQAYQTLWEQQ